MYKFNDKLIYKQFGDRDSKGIPVSVVSAKLSPTAQKVRVESNTGERMWVEIAKCCTVEEWQNCKNEVAEVVEVVEVAEVVEVFNILDPAQFAQTVLALDKPEAIKEMCDRLCDRVFPVAKSHNPKSRSDKLNRLGYNKLFREVQDLVEGKNAFYQTKQDGSLWLRHLYFRYTGIADTNWSAINAKAAEKVKGNLADQVVGLDIAKYEDSVKLLLESERIWEIGAGLISASGRRPSEVAICGGFEADGDGLIFDGQAKKRGKESEAYPIPLINCTPELFLEKLQIFRNSPEVRRYADREDLREATSPINVQINRLGIIPVFGWLPVPGEKSNPTCSDLRAAWVTIVEQQFKPEGKYSLLFRSEMLGHKLKVEGVAALNYSRYAVATESSQVDFVADLREVEAACQEWEKEVSEILAELKPTSLLPEILPIKKTPEKSPNGNVDTPAPESNIELTIQKSGSPVNGRHEHDFYETPPWLTLLALANVPLSGKILEPCVGHKAITSILRVAGLEVATNDIDPAKPADFHLDATLPESWADFPAADWVITNPPYADMSAPIVQNAYAHATKGIVMVLRQNWAEACEDRREFLAAHPPTTLISVPRYCYRKGKNENWSTDQCPTWIYVWDKSSTSGLTKMITLWDDLIPLFHRTPDGIPSDEAIAAEVERIVGIRCEVAKVEKPQPVAAIAASDREQEQIDRLLAANQSLGDKRFYVSQTLIKRLLRCRDQTANLLLRLNKVKIDALNKGINHTVNRGREKELEALISFLIN